MKITNIAAKAKNPAVGSGSGKGVRKGFVCLFSGGPGTGKTETAYQIAEEMENLSGILIATTNLTQNMDKAFERRFLYKITFDKPCTESRMGIWNALLPVLPEDLAAELSGKFDLSGGQIENIARKIEVDSIISGGDLSMDDLVQYCRDESQNSFSSSKRIGFGNG
ncbi:MAG: hypothetical protein LBQ94_05720 [Treponema sp.]|jgi:SpoVK/Ycf46/Vps4 family AAA+-type ATPase|nr:hypothetical protein [Treponema sp.]